MDVRVPKRFLDKSDRADYGSPGRVKTGGGAVKTGFGKGADREPAHVGPRGKTQS